MMKTLIKIFVISTAITLCSCSAVYLGLTTGNASLSSNNFKIVRMATGTASVHSILGLGGIGKKALVLEAKKNLLKNNPLNERQALVNVTVDFKTSFVLIVRTQKATVSADIVEFNDQTLRKQNDIMPNNIKPALKEPFNNQPVEQKAVESESNKIINTVQPIENVPAPKVIQQEKDISPQTNDNPPTPPVQSFEPTILYSAPTEIVTSSGERYIVEAGDYFLGTLDEKGNPENGKLYDKKGKPKHVILPKRNH